MALIIGIMAKRNQSDYTLSLANLERTMISPNFVGIGSWFAGGAAVSPDGTKWLMTSRNVGGIAWGTMTEAHNWRTAFYAGVYTIIEWASPAPNAIRFVNGGTQVWLADDSADGIAVWNLSTPYDFTTRVFDAVYDLVSSVNEYGMDVYDNDTKIITTHANSASARDYVMSVAGDISTRAYVSSPQYAVIDNTAQDSHVSQVVKGKYYIAQDSFTSTADSLVLGEMSTPNDMTTLTPGVETRIFEPFIGRLWNFQYEDAQDYFYEANYSDDMVNIWRQTSKDSFVSNKAYQTPASTLYDIMPTNLPFVDMGHSPTIIIDHKFEAGTANLYYELCCGNSSNHLITRYDDVNNRFFFQLFNGTTAVTIYTASGAFTADGNYHRVAFVYDQTVGMSIYIDGVLSNSNTTTTLQNWNTTVDQTVSMYIGGRYAGTQESGGVWRGVQVYNVPLSASDIADISNNWNDTKAGLVASWGDQKGQYFWKSDVNNYWAGVEKLTQETGVTYLLDEHPGAQGAFSLRKLSSTATLCCRLIRSSDSAEVDLFLDDYDNIGLTSLVTGDIPLGTWAGANDVKIKTWYDQSGNNNHATGISGVYPYLLRAGVLEIKNGHSAIKGDSTESTKGLYTSGHLGLIETNDISVFQAGTPNNVNSRYLVTEADAISPSPYSSSWIGGGAGPSQWWVNGTAVGTAAVVDVPFINVGMVKSSTEIASVINNGVASAEVAVTAGILPTVGTGTGLLHPQQDVPATSMHNGWVSEIILYRDYKLTSGEALTISDKMNDHYNVY